MSYTTFKEIILWQDKDSGKWIQFYETSTHTGTRVSFNLVDDINQATPPQLHMLPKQIRNEYLNLRAVKAQRTITVDTHIVLE